MKRATKSRTHSQKRAPGPVHKARQAKPRRISSAAEDFAEQETKSASSANAEQEEQMERDEERGPSPARQSEAVENQEYK